TTPCCHHYLSHRMDRAPTPGGGGGVAREGDRLSYGHGGARQVRGTLPTLRLSRPAHRVRQQRDQLLRYLPDRRPAAGGSFSFPPVERRLAPPHRRTGMRDCLSNICSIGSA